MAVLLRIIYIYQYKDHLGNTRVSFTKNSAGVLEVTDTNNYYPFGLNHIGNSFLSSLGSYNAYKYNGKEVQETGMYDYGARMYMPDLGRWGVVDAYAEIMRRYSPYNYAFNNPVNYIDPDGNVAYNPRDIHGDHSAFNDDFDANSSLSGYNGMSGSLGMYFANDAGAGGHSWGMHVKGDEEKSDKDPKKEKTGPNFWQRMGGFFSSLFGSDKGAGISSFLVGAEVSRVVQVGEAISITAESFYTSAGILATRSLWGLPFMLNGDSGFVPNSKPITRAIDTPVTTTDNSKPEQTLTLFRGVHGKHPDLANAYLGSAIPWGGPATAEQHNAGDNNSMYTSWSTSISVANYSASRRGPGGVILKQTFHISRLSFFNRHRGEQEVQVFGPVHGAQVIKPWGAGTWTPYLK